MTVKFLCCINLPVARVTAFETDKGTVTGAVTHWLRGKAGGCQSYDARVGAERLSWRKSRGFLESLGNEWYPLEEDPPKGASGSTKVGLRCRVVTGGGGKATTTKT